MINSNHPNSSFSLLLFLLIAVLYQQNGWGRKKYYAKCRSYPSRYCNPYKRKKTIYRKFYPKRKKQAFKIESGILVGTPSALNLVLRIWGPPKIPIIIQGSGMILKKYVQGIEGLAGWLFDPNGNFQQFLAVGISVTQLTFLHPSDPQKTTLWGIGPFYGFRWGGFNLQTGLVFGPPSTIPLSSTWQLSLSSPYPRLSIGYTFNW